MDTDFSKKITRRELITAGSTALAATAFTAFAQQKYKGCFRDEGSFSRKKCDEGNYCRGKSSSSTKHTDLIQVATECVDAGRACMQHCVNLYKTGDNSLSQCAKLVNETIIMCSTLKRMCF